MKCKTCGALLNELIDYDMKRHRMFKHCIPCREAMKFDEEYIQRQAARRQAKWELEEKARVERKLEEIAKEGTRCVRCGYPLRAIYRAYKVCGKCMREEEEQEKKSMHRMERMKAHCVDCPWKSFHGEYYSCLSAHGTGPLTRDCLKYTAGNYLHVNVNIIVEDEEDE